MRIQRATLKKIITEEISKLLVTEDWEGSNSIIDDAVLGEYIAKHSGDGDPREALGHLEDEIKELEGIREALNNLIADEKRQEINDMMDEEGEEIQFAKDNPQYTTRTFKED